MCGTGEGKRGLGTWGVVVLVFTDPRESEPDGLAREPPEELTDGGSVLTHREFSVGEAPFVGRGKAGCSGPKY